MFPVSSLILLPPLQLIGIAGAAVYILSYIALTLRLIDAESIVFFGLNLLAAAMILLSLGHAFNVAALISQLFFVCISAYGIVSRLRPGGGA